MQLLAKFKKNSVRGVQSHLKFSKAPNLEGGSEHHVQIFLKLW